MAEKEGALLPVPGIGAAKWKVLADNGYSTISRLAMAKVTDLTALEGIGEGIALKVIGAAQEASGIGAPKKASAIYAEWKKDRRFLTSGSHGVDKLLGGGFCAGTAVSSNTYEVAGKNGHGKSQISAQALANTIAPKEVGGWGGTARLIDTEGTGGPIASRVHDMLLGHGIPAQDVPAFMDNLEIVACPNSESQVNVVRRMLENNQRFDTLIVDGLMTKFRAEFVGRATLAERQGMLSDHTDDLNVYASMNRSLVIFTNQVSDSPELYGGTYAIGGNIVGHSAKYRLMVKKAGKGNLRIVRLDKAPDLPEGEAIFMLTTEGIADDPKAGKEDK